MKKYFYVIAAILSISNQLYAQTVYEVGIKPFEYTKLNFETNIGLGKNKSIYGIILSFRPGTRQSSDVDNPSVKNSNFLQTAYETNPYVNHLYTSFTTGIYYKYYFTPKHHFLEADLFYRNWYYNRKQSYLDHSDYDEDMRYSYDGLRTENINVYGLKLLIGKTFIFNAEEKRNALCIDLLGGIGLRYKTNNYQTYNGTVNGVYYTYLKETGSQWIPSAHFTIRISISNMKR